ncbi:Gfo/Idh/MocA family oxidoreductase [Streptomyces sp. DG2A-72]|uniref:Gfo/Idh/MocA family protein n=1 Tax=Streptomyces sp. DG2A-72 TaxID=3051386 RepID=UPI00265BC5AE|nr:Gfo/Idh/MocA family oxidoreductase [Streptomyces sp. DG2A-72]MDO0939341.1 Gfo/Idh/MocA family oxidoreductase [Streptomyces sp. DG2A-72]
MTRPIRMGVMGCAAIARRRMLPSFAAAPGIEVTAVAARSAARAEEVARTYGCRPVTGYGDLLADASVDAVYIPLPAALHATWVEAALLAGKHVLAEKPMSLSAGRTAELLNLARSRGLALMENVMFVHHPQHARLRDLLAEIGELRALVAEFAVPGLPPGDIRYNRALGGGALWDTGVYPVRAALHFLGTELHTVGATLTQEPELGVDIAGAALLRTPGGVHAQLSFGLDHAYRNRCELWGSKGHISVDRYFTPPADHQPVVRLEQAVGSQELVLDAADQVARTVSAFADAVRAGEVLDGPVVRRQAELLDELRAAAGG